MEYKEEDYLMLSGIQHFAFCRRQWALIHIEQLWSDNLRTTEGNLLHEKCHDGYSSESRRDVILSRGVPIFSRDLGVSGECDVVEFRSSECGIMLEGKKGRYDVYPVEYKHGEPKDTDVDILQLVAQAMCLEEMLCCKVEKGAIFYGKTKHRESVDMTSERRESVRHIFSEMHEYMRKGHIPKVKTTKGCKACSLRDLCLPAIQKKSSAKGYLEDTLGKVIME